MIHFTGKYHAQALLPILLNFNLLAVHEQTHMIVTTTVGDCTTKSMVKQFKLRAVQSAEYTMDIIGYGPLNKETKAQVINIPLKADINYEMFYKVVGSSIVLTLWVNPHLQYKIELAFTECSDLFESMFESINTAFASNMLNYNVNKNLFDKGWGTDWVASNNIASVWSRGDEEQKKYSMTPDKHE